MIERYAYAPGQILFFRGCEKVPGFDGSGWKRQIKLNFQKINSIFPLTSRLIGS